MASDKLKAQALAAVCSCYYYDLQNNINEMTSEDLGMIVRQPYICHYLNNEDEDEINDCPLIRHERAEEIRDSRREDGII